MLKYNFKDFFSSRLIHSENWASNGHFMFNKSILTKSQKDYLDKSERSNDTILKLMDIVTSTKENFDGVKFNPSSIIIDYNSNGITQNILYDENTNLAINENYYNFFIKRGCTLYKGKDRINPLLIFDKNNEYIGVLLPIRIDIDVVGSGLDYKNYINQLKQDKQAKDDLKKLNKKCLYISNNKAVIRNKPLHSVSKLTGNSKYNNLYVNDLGNGYYELYVDLETIHISLNRTYRKDYFVEEADYNLQGLDEITLDYYKNNIKNRLTDGNNTWITVAEVKLMELAGESDEFINSLHLYRNHVKELRTKEEKERELQKQQEEQEYIDEQNKVADDMITQAEQSILKGDRVWNNDITIYESRYNSSTTSLILHLMKLYDIKVPLKTQGWINNALNSIYYKDGRWTYDYYSSSSNSTVFSKYLDILADKVELKYKTAS